MTNFFLKLIFVILNAAAVIQANYKGCYEEKIRERHFFWSPGSYLPEQMTLNLCRGNCGTFKYGFAAVTEGKFCFCANALPDESRKQSDDTACNIPCQGDTGVMCGGKTYLSVASTTTPITGLTITSDAPDIVSTNTEITLDVGVTTGSNVVYHIDFDDGAGPTDQNANDTVTRTFYVPGEYHIVVVANDLDKSFDDQFASTAVSIMSPTGKTSVECEDVFATFEDNICTFTAWSGTQLKTNIDVSTISLTVDIEDPPLSIVGVPIPSKLENMNIPKENKMFFNKRSEFSVSGRIISWQVNIDSLGSSDPVKALVLKPHCTSGTYCYGTNSCEIAACLFPTTTYTNCVTLCGQTERCTDTCTQTDERSNPSFSYELVFVKDLPVTQDGYQSIEETEEIEVEPGYVIGVYMSTTSDVVKRVTTDIQHGDWSPSVSSQVPSVGSTYDPSLFTSEAFRLTINAVASAGSKVHIPLSFDTDGLFTLTTVTTNTITSSPVTASTTVTVIEGVDKAVLISNSHVISQTAYSYEVEEHTGSNVYYNWTFGEDEFFKLTDRIKSHSFLKGTYNVSVVVYNLVSSKSTSREVIVEDEILGLDVSVQSEVFGVVSKFTLSMQSGSDVTCKLNFGDGTAQSQLNDIEDVADGPFEISHEYLSPGTYSVETKCVNYVSTQTNTLVVSIEEEIQNLAMVSEGAEVDANFYLRWTVDAGTNIVWTVTFDGANLPTSSIVSYGVNTWRSQLQPARSTNQNIPLVVKAVNSVSNMEIAIDFAILSKIVQPTFTADIVNTTTGTTITWTANVAAGSDVKVAIDFKDGSADETSTTGAWAQPLRFSHSYNDGGIFQVTATFSNAEGSYERKATVTVIVGLNDISCEMEEYALYYPPATTKIRFTGTALPTEPTLTLFWGETHGPQDGEITDLVLNQDIEHTYSDTGTYHVRAHLENFLGEKECVQDLIVVEKLAEPSFQLPFESAGLNVPFEIKYCLKRAPQGELCKLTFDFGDGTTKEIDRQGDPFEGCDSEFVTYTTNTAKTITVKAKTPVEEEIITKTVTIKTGVEESKLTITPSATELDMTSEFRFVVSYAGSVPPSTMIKVDYGNGQTNDVAMSSSSQTITHRFNSDGVLNVSVTVINDVSAVKKLFEIGVFQSFQNLAAEIYYLADLPYGEERTGYNNQALKFSISKPVYCRMSSINNAFADSYSLTITDTSAGTVVESGTFTDATFSFVIQKAGTYKVRVEAINPMVQTVAPLVTIEMIETIVGFTVFEGNEKVKANEVKKFGVIFDKVGTDTCLYVNFGDESKALYTDISASSCTHKPGYSTLTPEPLTDLREIEHIYTENKFYSTVFVASNEYNEMTVTLDVSISEIECKKPIVDIENRQEVLHSRNVYKKCNNLKINGQAKIDCKSVKNKKTWWIETINPDTDQVISTDNLDDVGEEFDAVLLLNARRLDKGVYKVNFKMTMDGDYGPNVFEAQTFTYIEIEDCELVATMVEGGVSEVVVGNGETARFEMAPLKYSTDPNVDPSGPQGLQVTGWACAVLGVDSSTPCESTVYISNANAQSIDLTKLDAGKYQFKSFLAKGGKTAETEIVLDIVNGDPPNVVIKPNDGTVYYQVSSGFKILESSQVAVTCLCTDCSSTDELSYQWSIFRYDRRWNDGWGYLTPTDLAGKVEGLRSEEMSISPSVFELLGKTEMRVQCELTRGGSTGRVATNLMVHKPPHSGSCSVSPKEREMTTEKAWTIECSGWQSDVGIVAYQIYTHWDSSVTDRQVTLVQTESGSFNITVALAEGPDYNNYTQKVIIYVRDILESVHKYDAGDVVVRPMPTERLRELTNNILKNSEEEFEKLFASSNPTEIREASSNFLSLLNSDSRQTQKEHAGDKAVASNYAASVYGAADDEKPVLDEKDSTVQAEQQYDLESQRDGRASIRADLIKRMSSLKLLDIDDIQGVTSFLNLATIYGDELDKPTQKIVMQIMESVSDFISNPANLDKIPAESVFTALENNFGVLGGIFDAMGNNGEIPLRSERLATHHTKEFTEFSTDLNAKISDDILFAEPYEESLRAFEKQLNKGQAAIAAKDVRSKSQHDLDKQAQTYSTYSVPGQKNSFKSDKMMSTLTKMTGSPAGTSLSPPDSSGGVTFTGYIGVAKDEQTVALVSQETNNPSKYSEAAESISKTSNYISVNIYNKDGSKKQVKNLKDPIEVVIPRHRNTPVPEFQDMDLALISTTNLIIFPVLINRTDSYIQMDFKGIDGRQFLIVLKMGKEVKLGANRTDDECDAVFLHPPSMSTGLEDEYRDVFFLEASVLGNFIGNVSIGLRELEEEEFDMDLTEGCNALPRYENGSDTFKGVFQMRQYVSQCLALSEDEEDWDTKGCKVSKKTDHLATVCLCNHLSTFAGGWVVMPNTIDWGYVFANADFLSNPTIYITTIFITLLYIVAVVFARFRDKKMKEILGLAPLSDNDPKDRYFYELVVCTGMRRGAGTDSQVCFVLSGEDDETDVRAFSDSKRKIFRRGQVNGFLMSVPRPLGQLNFLRVWHDNSGKGRFSSWYLNYVMVRDVQTDQKHMFLCDRWLAVEEDDGQVDRVLPVAGKEQLSDFSYQFGERSRKNMSDGHLWFSVITRPPQSRFTCVQRVSCCLCLLTTTMLANAMFYNTTPENEQANNSFSVGPFTLSPEQVFIGVISNLIVFPVNFLLVVLFRKSRPRHKRPSRIDMAMKQVAEDNKQASINDVKPEVDSLFSMNQQPTSLGPRSRADSTMSSQLNKSTEKLTAAKKKKKCELPWYCTIFAWILLWLTTLGCGAVVVFYGISFQDETCRKWITSMIISTIMSVFITQPIKVFLFAVILALIVKNPGDDEDEEVEDEEDHHIDQDAEFLHSDTDAMFGVKPRKVGYKPPDSDQLEAHRNRRLKEIKMWAIVREVIIYAFFLWILMLISYRQLGASHFLYKDTMNRVFIANNETDIDFHKLRNTDEFWIWAKSGLINGIRAGYYYNAYPPLRIQGFINDKVSRILGYATMRQLRVKPALCEVPSDVSGIVEQCNINYNIQDQEEGDFRRSWEKLQDTDTENETSEEYLYRSADSLNGYPYWGILSLYSGGGYVAPLTGSKVDLLARLTRLENEKWIDKYTRAVFVEFTVYNPQVNLFAIGTILAEFHPSGGLVQSYRFETAMLLPYMTNAMIFQIACEVAYLLFTLFFIIREIREMVKQKLKYLLSFWNWVELTIIGMSIAAIVIFFYKTIVTSSLTEDFKGTNGNGYVKFQYVAYWNEMFTYMIGFLVFLSTLKFLKLLRFNKKISMLSATLSYSARNLIHFSVIFLIVFLAFSMLFYLTFMNIDIDYSTFISSVVASILMMMGKFNIYTMIMAEPVLTQVFVLLFVVSLTFVIVNMFVSILNETFTAVREDVKKQGNDYEIVEFMLSSFRKWAGFRSQETETPANKTKEDMNNQKENPFNFLTTNTQGDVQEFPDRIDRLLQSISSAYMNTDSFAQMYQKKRDASLNVNKNLLRTGRSPSPAPGARMRKGSDAVTTVDTQ